MGSPPNKCADSTVVRVLIRQAKGRGFESRRSQLFSIFLFLGGRLITGRCPRQTCMVGVRMQHRTDRAWFLSIQPRGSVSGQKNSEKGSSISGHGAGQSVEILENSKKILEISRNFLDFSKNFLDISKKFLDMSRKVLDKSNNFLYNSRNFVEML